MKQAYMTILIVCMMTVASSAQAAFLWNWSIDADPEGPITGTLMTSEDYLPGTKSITAFTVEDNGSIAALFEGSYTPGFEFEFDWDGVNVTAYNFFMSAFDGSFDSEINCISGQSCSVFISDTFDQDYSPTFQASPVPIPAAAWLFMSGLLGLVYTGRKARQAAA